MADGPAAQPLLSSPTEGPVRSKSPRLLVSLGRWVIKVLMWVIFLAWFGLIFFFPTDSERRWIQVFFLATKRTVFGLTGSVFLLTCAPILGVALLAYIYVASFSEEHHQRKTPGSPRLRLRTFPVLLEGPFGVVSAAEFIGIVFFTAYVLWAITAYSIQIASFPKKERW